MRTREELIHQWPFLLDLARLAAQICAAKAVYVFGSKARGDDVGDSDFDIAVDTNASNNCWSKFVIDGPEILCLISRFDFVRLDEANENLRNSIAAEGVMIYDGKVAK